MKPRLDICALNPNILACADYTPPDDNNDLITEVRDIDLITPVDVGGAGVCPQPLVADFMGTSIVFSYELPCRAASMLKPLVLALAWLSAGVIFIGGVRNG